MEPLVLLIQESAHLVAEGGERGLLIHGRREARVLMGIGRPVMTQGTLAVVPHNFVARRAKSQKGEAYVFGWCVWAGGHGGRLVNEGVQVGR